MEIAYAFMAKFADTSADGTFALVGGGWDGVKTPTIPINVPAMALVVHLSANPDECGREHNLDINLFGPTGAQFPFSGHLPFIPVLDQNSPDHRVGVNCIVGMLGMTFAEQGDYQFRLSVDGLQLGIVTFSVIHRPVSG
jgi:hypothetical protein